MLRIHLLYEYGKDSNPHGCGHIRLLRPFHHPTICNAIKVTQGIELTNVPMDVVLVERLWRPDISVPLAEKLVADIRKKGAKFLYTLDDNLIDLHINQPWGSWPNDIMRMVVRYFIREADGVIVSTDNLKNRFNNLNDNIEVVPNALDEQLFPSENKRIHFDSDKKDSTILIGYMGTMTHVNDLMMIMQPLREILHQYRDCVKFQLVGITGEDRISECFKGLAFEPLNVGKHHQYPQFIKWAMENMHWDIGIAPLEDTKFNKYKSDIKFLDYSLLGIPTVCSDVDAYKKTVRHLETGWLCENNAESWFDALDKLISDKFLRNKIANNAYEYVTINRTLQHRASDWEDAIRKLLSKSEIN
ncbi:MAG: family 2 glycosyl [Geobacteraceae bacterium]|nr:MAG: family 2 glycosyl [Geobacteraceae bacterium]